MEKLNGLITISLLVVLLISIGLAGLASKAFAQESEAAGGEVGFKLIGAGMAFGLAALGAGIGLGFVGAAGLAAISDNPKMQSRVFIIVGMVESIAIYGIVMMFIILGQT
jgi:V/A-type H+/Na+-transporting ATPase subunit K